MNYIMLKDICAINMGQSPDSNSYNDEGYGLPFFQGNADFGERYPIAKKWCSAPQKIAKPEDILISVRAPIGAVNYAKEKCCIGRGLAAITLDKSKVSKEFIFWLLKSKNQELNNKGVGSTFKSIGRKVLEETLVPDLTKEKQMRYSEILEKLYFIIQSRMLQQKELDELVKARFVEMFGDIKNEEKYSGILLGNICKTISGGTPSTKVTEYYTGDIPWISTVSLGPNHIDGKLAKGYITSLAIKNSATKLIPAGNILFGTRVGVGKSSINDVEMCTNQDIVAIVDVDECKYNKLFIKCVLDSYQAYFDSIKKGATILGVTSDDLKDCLIPNVPINIQNEFVVFVEQVDKSKSVIEKSLKELETLQASLMQKYFS